MPVNELKLAPAKKRFVLKTSASSSKANKSRITLFFLGVALLAVLFSVPLYHLLRLAATDDLYSDIPIVPLSSLYLVWLRRERMPATFKPAFKSAALFCSAGLLTLAASWLSAREAAPQLENYLAWNMSALLLFFAALCCVFPGGAFMRVFACPMALLIFTIPFPTGLLLWIETLLQHGSAVFAGLFFSIAGDPVVRDGLYFHLPNINLQVAPECSGIHSTVVLAIVSIAGSWLFLRSPWKRAVLVLAVIPLALIRNGFRIFVIGRLCAAYGPQMINSPIHRHGGPLFFVLSLFPFFLLLIFLRKTEGTNREPSTRPLL
jgi:exosortase C (VPDSG-CTERM-specific)